jgi:FAD/FMN-containing dehydrogenase
MMLDLIRSDDSRYDDARGIHNAMIDKRPAVIARCATADDVALALKLARRHEYQVAVRAGGHSVAGMSVNDGGLVIDVRPMKTITVDPFTRRVKVGAGVTWGEFDRATQEHGLATTGGRVSTTGVAGLTLGGGSGWTERKYGLTCDNLVSANLVTADGRRITASQTQHPDLFWALHGGGGNFGVVTAFEFSLHQLGPVVLAGLMVWPGEAGRDLAAVYRDLAYDSADELGSGLVFVTGPPEEFIPSQLRGETVAALALMWAGEPGDGLDAVKPFRDLQPAADLVAPMPYATFQSLLDDPPGMHNYWSADYHDEFPDPALDVFAEFGQHRKSPYTQHVMFPWGGAVAQAEPDATPLSNRSARWITHPFAVWEDPADTAVNVEWARGYRREIAPFANGAAYLNFIGDEGEDRVRAAFGEQNYARLAAIKAEYDPQNIFRGNQNIKPAA